MSAGRRLSILAEEDDDLMLSAVNLVDVFLVLVVALLTAVALQQQSHADETVIRNPGQPGMEIVVRKDGQEIKYRGNGGSAEGQGERAGVAVQVEGRLDHLRARGRGSAQAMRIASLLARGLAVAVLSLCVPLVASAANTSSRVLFLSVDITPAAKHALLEREGKALGFEVRQIEYPLRGAPVDKDPALDRALREADLVWIDIPHATAEARLHQILDAALQRAALPAPRVLWIPAGEPAASDRSLRAYLQAGGPANTRAAFAIARAQLDGKRAPDLGPPQLIPQRGIHYPGAPKLFADAAEFRAWGRAARAARRARRDPAASLSLRAGQHRVAGPLARDVPQAGPARLRRLQRPAQRQAPCRSCSSATARCRRA